MQESDNGVRAAQQKGRPQAAFSMHGLQLKPS
jgi:hypothetical protein